MRYPVAAAFAAALFACGPGPELSVKIQALAGGVDYRIWLFGAAVTCAGSANSAAERTALEAAPACGTANPDTTTPPCFIQLDQIALNTTFRFDSVTPGSRTIFGVERDATQNPIGWACGAVTINSGSAASVTLTFQAN